MHQKQEVSEKRKLLELHLIATTAELEEVLQEIDKTKISQSKKDSKKLSTRRKHLISDIIADFRISMADFPLPDLVCNPLLFVEKEVDHKFQVNGTVEPF